MLWLRHVGCSVGNRGPLACSPTSYLCCLPTFRQRLTRNPHTVTVTAVATKAAIPRNRGARVPSIPIDVKLAKSPPAGTKPP